MGWEDAPAHVCRGGDARGLAFCCPPVKPCPVHTKLAEIGMSPQEFVNIKQEFGSKTKLGVGAATCFGSLVWCCKASKPCPLRDMELEEILKNTNINKVQYSDEDIQKLAATFEISFDEAKQALDDSGNDLKAAIKTLRLKSL